MPFAVGFYEVIYQYGKFGGISLAWVRSDTGNYTDLRVGSVTVARLMQGFDSGKLPVTAATFSHIDLNSLTKTCSGYCIDCTNIPAGAGNGYIEAIGVGGLCLQRYIEYNSGSTYKRQFVGGGTWTGWS